MKARIHFQELPARRRDLRQVAADPEEPVGIRDPPLELGIDGQRIASERLRQEGLLTSWDVRLGNLRSPTRACGDERQSRNHTEGREPTHLATPPSGRTAQRLPCRGSASVIVAIACL